MKPSSEITVVSPEIIFQIQQDMDSNASKLFTNALKLYSSIEDPSKKNTPYIGTKLDPKYVSDPEILRLFAAAVQIYSKEFIGEGEITGFNLTTLAYYLNKMVLTKYQDPSHFEELKRTNNTLNMLGNLHLEVLIEDLDLTRT